MKTKDVKKLKPKQRFLYWIRERHAIYEKKEAGLPRPWTDDEVLQRYFFTNPYRENDRVTKWFKQHIREPLRGSGEVLFATIAFRWFNKPETGQVLLQGAKGPLGPDCLLRNWRTPVAKSRLNKLSNNGRQAVFTGAYIIMSPQGTKKIDGICGLVGDMWKARHRLLEVAREEGTLEGLWRSLITYPYLGGFMAYEIVTDIRHTDLLKDAPDVDTWCNPGPGCCRGLLRVLGQTPPTNKTGGTKRHGLKLPPGTQETMLGLLQLVRKNLPHMPKFEMREVEHSLCEFDKYERMLWEQGRSKRMYNGLKEDG